MKKLFCLILSLFFVSTLYANDKIIAVYRPDGVSIIKPAWKSKKVSETEEQFLERVYQDTVKDSELSTYEYEVITTQDLPSREYRNAWEGSKGQKIKVNAQKKQAIIDKKTNKENAKISGKGKLKQLGLTDDEISSLIP